MDQQRPAEEDALPEERKLNDLQGISKAVEQHGQMVYNACLRILGNVQDAEDAAQATFLVFLKKAKHLKHGTKLPGWLYRTAKFVSQSHLRAQKRRKRHEEAAIVGEGKRKELDRSWQMVKPELDRVLDSLPAHYRDVVILSYLEGHTRREVASILGVPEGTVAARLDRGVKKLRGKLRGHGVIISGAVLAMVLAERCAEAAVPETLLPSVIVAAETLARGGLAAAVSNKVLVMAKGGMKMMMWAKVKIAAVVYCSVAVLGIGIYAMDGVAPKQPSEKMVGTEKEALTDIDFKGGRDEVVFQLAFSGGGRGGKRNVVTIYGNGRMDLDYPKWDPEKDKPLPKEQKRGYLVRDGKLKFSPEISPTLPNEDRLVLLDSIGKWIAERKKSPARRKKGPKALVVDAATSHFIVRTKKAEIMENIYGLSHAAEQDPILRRLLAVQKKARVLSKNFWSRRIDLKTQNELLTGFLHSADKTNNEHRKSLSKYGNSKIIPELLKNFRESEDLNVIHYMGGTLEGICRRGMGTPEIAKEMLVHAKNLETREKFEKKRASKAIHWAGEFGGLVFVKPLLVHFAKFPTRVEQEGRSRSIYPNPAGNALKELAKRSVGLKKIRSELLGFLANGKLIGDSQRISQAFAILRECSKKDKRLRKTLEKLKGKYNLN